MFRVFSRPSSGAQCLQWQPLVLPSYRGDSRAVFVVGPAGRLSKKTEIEIIKIKSVFVAGFGNKKKFPSNFTWNLSF
jgi:hypothetical protein